MTAQASTIVAICALFVSVVSLGASMYFGWCTRDHNRRAVKPLPFIAQPDYEDRIAVVVQNNGTGPLILKTAQASSSVDGRSGHLIDLIPPPPPGLLFSKLNRVEQIRAIRPGDEVALIDLPIDVGGPGIAEYREELRRALGYFTIELTYTDIYEGRFPVYSIKLAWFHRHFT